MATKKAAKKKEPEALTVEQRLDRIENDMKILGAKLRTHGIHLAPAEEPEEAEVEEQDEA